MWLRVVCSKQRAVPPQSFPWRGRVPTGDGCLCALSNRIAGPELHCPIHSKGPLRQKARQEGNLETPSERFLRKTVDLLLHTAHGHQLVLSHWLLQAPFFSWHLVLPRPRFSPSSPRAMMAFSKLLLCTDTAESQLYKPPAFGYWCKF